LKVQIRWQSDQEYDLELRRLDLFVDTGSWQRTNCVVDLEILPKAGDNGPYVYILPIHSPFNNQIFDISHI